MNAPSSTLPSTVGRGLRGIAGVTITALMLLAMVSTGAEIGAEGGWFVALAMGSSLLLLVACVKNWPGLWNTLGRVLRTLLGERGARIALGLIAATFAVSALVTYIA